MAKISITVTDEQAAVLPLAEGQTVAEFCQYQINFIAQRNLENKRQCDFDALTDAQKATAITAGKAG